MGKRGFELVKNKKNRGEVKLPIRGTRTSAGYDFYTPVDLEIKPQEKVFFWTDVKAYMDGDDEFLALDIRSSKGIKDDLMLSNTLPIIDHDYYNNPDNEGNIGISIRNMKPNVGFEVNKGEDGIEWMDIKDLTFENTVKIKAGDRVAQGIFMKYLESDNCNTEKERESGIGSTNK